MLSFAYIARLIVMCGLVASSLILAMENKTDDATYLICMAIFIRGISVPEDKK